MDSLHRTELGPEAENLRQPRHVYVSVDNKKGSEGIASVLNGAGAEIHSMEGTLECVHTGAGIEVTDMLAEQNLIPKDVAAFLKGVQPELYAGIALDPREPKHRELLEKYKIPSYDVIVVGAHNPEKRIDHAAALPAIMGAKFADRVTVIISPKQYPALEKELFRNGGRISQDFRDSMAAEAFQWVSNYYGRVATLLRESSR